MSDMQNATGMVQSPPPGYMEQNASMMEQRATAEIQSRYAIAQRFQRNIEQVRQDMMKECSRPSFCVPDESKNGSSVAIYRVPRAGSNIEGVTIRFAEMAQRAYHNLGIQIHPLGEDQNSRSYECICTDYETNNITSEIVSVPKSIERTYAKDSDVVLGQRQNSKGKLVYIVLGTDDDLMMKRNALISKAKRNLIMGHIPGWLVEECIATVRSTARAKDAEDPDAAKRKLFDAFAKVGVSAEQLASYLGHSNALNPAELETLRDYYSAMREGYTTWKDILAAKEEGGGEDDGKAAKVEELVKALEWNPAQTRKTKAAYVGRVDELIQYLEQQVQKKQQDGSQKKAAQQEAKLAKEDDTTASQPASGSHGGASGTATTATTTAAATGTTAAASTSQESKPKPQPAKQTPPPAGEMENW